MNAVQCIQAHLVHLCLCPKAEAAPAKNISFPNSPRKFNSIKYLIAHTVSLSSSAFSCPLLIIYISNARTKFTALYYDFTHLKAILTLKFPCLSTTFSYVVSKSKRQPLLF